MRMRDAATSRRSLSGVSAIGLTRSDAEEAEPVVDEVARSVTGLLENETLAQRHRTLVPGAQDGADQPAVGIDRVEYQAVVDTERMRRVRMYIRSLRF